jgi:hypothetical protein
MKVEFHIVEETPDLAVIDLAPCHGYRTIHLVSPEGHTVNLMLDEQDRLLEVELMGFRYKKETVQ